MTPEAPHVDAAEDYARGVLAGSVPAGKWVKAAAKRFVEELDAQLRPDFPYYFSDDEGERVCAFIEQLSHVKGKWAKGGERIHLEPWQCFIVVNIFGWLRKRDHARRYRETYLEIPRKNGKSVLAAGIGLWMFTGDDEHGAEVYAGATTEKQAWEVFRPAKQMLEQCPELQEATGAEAWAKALSVPSDLSRFEPVIGKPGDGASPSCGIVDEYHEHDTPDMVDTFITGMGAREQPLLLIITTAGYNTGGPCYAKREQACKVLDGVLDNPELFALMYSIDAEDDWTDPAVLRKANPNFGVSVDGEFLEAQQRQATLNPDQQTRFRTKHLNEWCNAKTAWMSAPLWKAATDPALARDELIAERAECFISVDLASKTDLASEQTIFRRLLDGRWHYYLFGRYWLPEETIEEPGAANQHLYRRWVIEGWLTATEGATIDYDVIVEQVKQDLKATNAGEFIFDPFNATHLANKVSEAAGDSVAVVEFQQKPWNFAVPMDDITAALKDGRFHHDGNPITAWCMSNVVGKVAKKDMYSPTKERPENKIDGAVATIMAMSRAMAEDPVDEGIDSWLKKAVV